MKAASAFNMPCLGLTLGTSGHIAVVSGFCSSSFKKPHITSTITTGTGTGTCASSLFTRKHTPDRPLFVSTIYRYHMESYKTLINYAQTHSKSNEYLKEVMKDSISKMVRFTTESDMVDCAAIGKEK
jgi:hypothetical protein